VKTSSGTLTYTLGTRNANTVLRLKNGETQVLAGLFRDDAQDTTNKVPGLSSIPLLGRLFSDKNTDRRKKEVVLLITPRILSNIAPPDATYTVFPAGIDSAQNAVGRVGRQPEYVAPASAATTVQETQAARAPGDKAYAEMATQDGTRQ
jgi:general secretion pathway protein D